MNIDDFSYDLPAELIASEPMARRSDSRLLRLPLTGCALSHHVFRELPTLLHPGDLLVFNDTRVIPARLYGRKETGGQVELLVERVLPDGTLLTQLRASKRTAPGTRIWLNATKGGATEPLEVLGREGEFYRVAFPDRDDPLTVLERLGHMPLPPYIQRAATELDRDRYQTVYGRVPGAVAAPTAGLHFDETLLSALKGVGVQTAFVTLHVGAGTFQPVRVTDIRQHQMHAEFATVSAETCAAVARCQAAGGRVIAVGTTAVRSLESAAAEGELQPFQGDTQIFIYPGFRFRVVQGLITNFHLPRSTLLMLVSAMAGRERILDAYRVAVAEQYRFFSYGDAMFLSP